MSWLLLVAAVALVAVAAEWRARRRAEQVTRACHELRRPLCAARLAVATLERAAAGAVTTEPSRAATVLDEQLRRCGHALDDLTAAGGGRRRAVRREAVDVGALLEEQAAGWALAAAAHDREVRLGARPAGLVVAGDGRRLGQALGNLVANALEHGRGGVELSARRVPGALRLEVRDAGPGLTAPLGRTARRARRGRGHRGRGLAICREIARAHGGRLVADGAVVAVELPFGEGAPRRLRATPRVLLPGRAG